MQKDMIIASSEDQKMDSAIAKAAFLFLVTSFYLSSNASAEDSYGRPVIPPVQPPLHPPIYPPGGHHHDLHDPPHYPPAYPPVRPPVTHPVHPHPYPRSLVAIEGFVFCQSCKHAGSDDLWGASPISGAVVKVECKNSKKVITLTATTNALGYFYVQTRNVTTYGHHKCKVYLVSSPLMTCNNPTNLHGGKTGDNLNRHKPFDIFNPPAYILYTVGPFAFLPKCHY